MPGFSITPAAAFPPVASDGFPRFMQWQHDGVDVGDTAVETVNFTGDGVTAVTVNSAGSTLDVQLGGQTFTWTEVPGDYTLVLTDAGMGLATTGTTGAQQITIPPSVDVEFLPGAAILVLQDGGAQAQIVPGIGVELVYRQAAFNPYTAGEMGILSLIYRGSDRWVVCGDLEAV